MWRKLCTILESVDAVMLTSAHNLRYFTGFAGGEGVCLIGKDLRCLFVDSRYTIEAKLEAVDFDVTEFSGGRLRDEIYAAICENNIRTLAFENSDMTVAAYEAYREKFTDVELVGVSSELEKLRMVKTEEEIEYITKAECIGDKAYERVLTLLREGVSESDIAAELEYQMRRLGAEGTSFETVVVSGAKSGMPHGKPDGKKLKIGDFVTMDFGCRVNGYCSDMTRTVVIGRASEEQRRIYNTVLEAQLAGLDVIRAGISGKEADSAAREIIDRAGYGRCFGHSLGHGVGLLIHEQPNLSPFSETILAENMVVTCEPGIYIEGLGGVRIEDTVVVKNGGLLNLAASGKELILCG